MAIADLWAVEMLLAAFAGGAFGAAIGALPAFTLTGLLVIVGETYGLVRTTLSVEGGTTLPAVPLTDSIAFGVVFGPHVSFAGGAAALAYAAKQGYLDGDFAYHPAKRVTRGLGSRWDVLAVGGLFGILGYWIATLSSSLALPVDPVALGVVLSAFAHRAVLGYPLVGSAPGSLLDMSPYEASVAGGGPENGAEEIAADGGRHPVEPWLPYQYAWPNVALLGIVVGVLGAYVAYLTASPFYAFGLTVFALVFLNAGVASIPVTHHMALPASTVVVASSGLSRRSLTPGALQTAVPLSEALLLGALLGLVGGLVGEFLQRLLYAHADTHLDPPAASIVVTSFLLALLVVAGVLPGPLWVPHP